jgi:hypothetical protein
MNGKRLLLIPVALLWVKAAYAGDSDFKVAPSASVYFQIGQLEQTFDPSETWPNKTWDQRCDLRLNLTATVREHLRIIVAAEAAMVTQVLPPTGNQSTGNTTTASYAFPREGQGIYSFGDDPENSFLQIALGYFPFKYNPQASNMGEYLFRTGTYPPFIINDFDDCEANLLGLRVSSTLWGSLHQDLLFTSETYYPPYGDYSLSYLIGYKPNNILDIGAGVCLSRLIPLDKNQTTPNSPVYDQNTNLVFVNGDSLDTLHYTFQGVKLMVRGAFDPKQFLPVDLLNLFQKEDGKLYFETAILGLKNYGADFSDVLKRWPVMVGFNIPTTKWGLDVLSLELEYFGFDYDKFSFPPGPLVIDNFSQDKWNMQNMFHWSLFATKTVVGGLSIKGLIGKDHYRNTGSTSPWAGVDNPVGQGSNAGELLVAHGDWHYTLRVVYSF